MGYSVILWSLDVLSYRESPPDSKALETSSVSWNFLMLFTTGLQLSSSSVRGGWLGCGTISWSPAAFFDWESPPDCEAWETSSSSYKAWEVLLSSCSDWGALSSSCSLLMIFVTGLLLSLSLVSRDWSGCGAISWPLEAPPNWESPPDCEAWETLSSFCKAREALLSSCKAWEALHPFCSNWESSHPSCTDREASPFSCKALETSGTASLVGSSLMICGRARLSNRINELRPLIYGV